MNYIETIYSAHIPNPQGKYSIGDLCIGEEYPIESMLKESKLVSGKEVEWIVGRNTDSRVLFEILSHTCSIIYKYSK